MDADRHVRLLTRGPERIEVRVVERAALHGVRPDEDAAHADRLRALHLADGGVHVLHRHARDADEALRIRRAVVGEPVVVDAAARFGERGILDRFEQEPDRRIEHRGVDALGVQVLEPLLRIEAAGMELAVAHADTDVGEGPAGEPDAHDAERQETAVLDVDFLLPRVGIPADAEVLVFNTGSGASYRF